jgi:hypothetical protein
VSQLDGDVARPDHRDLLGGERSGDHGRIALHLGRAALADPVTIVENGDGVAHTHEKLMLCSTRSTVTLSRRS